MPRVWCDCELERLLLEYQKHELLWNPNHPCFHNCILRLEAFKTIVQNLNTETNQQQQQQQITIRDCLAVLRVIALNFTKQEKKSNSADSRPRWQYILEDMREKLARDDDDGDKEVQKRTIVKRNSRSKSRCGNGTLLQSTVASRARAKSSCVVTNDRQTTDKEVNKTRKRKIGVSNARRIKLEQKGCCSCCCDAGKAKSRSGCPKTEYTRPQTAWIKQRDDYLENITWTSGNCAKTIECPAYAAYLERRDRAKNTCKPVQQESSCPCPVQDDPCAQKTWPGRRRDPEIQPTIPDSKTCRSRPTSCSPTRRKSPDKCTDVKPASTKSCTKPCPRPNDCCSCPRPSTEPTQRRQSNPLLEVCRKETCPNFQRPIISKSSANSGEPNQQPKIGARFENGVLEAYSQFKVVFPSGQEASTSTTTSPCITKPSSGVQKTNRRLQTDCKSTRDCAVLASTRCPGKRNARVGTEEDFVECCTDEQNESEPGHHDYVLLTPGGKYVPLVRANNDQAGDKVVFTECCTDNTRGLSQRNPDNCDYGVSRGCDKQSTQEDDKSTTKLLLLRCLEHMLNLEEQEEKGKCGETRDVESKPEKINCCPNCTTSRQKQSCPKPTVATSPREKLARDVLKVLKCALECKNDDDTEQDCCACETRIKGNEESVKCKINDDSRRSIITVTTQTSARDDKTASARGFRDCLQDDTHIDSVQEISAIRECNDIRTSLNCSNLCPSPKSKQANNDDNLVIRKSSRRRITETVDDCTGNQYLVKSFYETTVDRSMDKKSSLQDACTQEQIPSLTKETQCSERKRSEQSSVGTQKRDTVLEYLVRHVSRSGPTTECPRRHPPSVLATAIPNQCSPRRTNKSRVCPANESHNLTDDPRVNYLHSNQVHRSYASDPAERGRLKQYHRRRVCALKKVYDNGCN